MPMSPADRSADVGRRLDALLAGLAARRDIPHVVMAVSHLDGTFRWSGAAGQAQPDGTPMRVSTPYFIASIDKLLTAVMMTTLAEQGRLGLDTSIADHLPEREWRGLHKWDGIDRTRAITIEHLLTHTSGLPDWLEDAPRGGLSLVDRLARDGDIAMSLDEILAHVRDRLSPHFPPCDPASPRTRPRYSDTNYMLLARIVERVTGENFAAALDAMLFGPLGLTRTWVAGHTAPRDGAQDMAALWFGHAVVRIPGMLRSFHGVCSTVEDQTRLLSALIRGEAGAPGTWARLQSRWHRFGIPRDRAALRAPNWPIEYGLGVMRYRLPRWMTPFAPVPALVGHTGSTGTWLFHCAEFGLVMEGAVDQATAGPVPFRFLPRVLRACRTAWRVRDAR